MPEEIWREIHDVVQEAVTKTIPKKKKSKKAKWLSKERREVKSKRERERYTQLNAEFQRIARRGKKALFKEQGKEVEENNSMGKTRDFFKIIGDIKGTFHARMGTIKDRNGKDLTEADGKNTQKNYTRKVLMTQIATMMLSLP